jgi:hypothetical protein
MSKNTDESKEKNPGFFEDGLPELSPEGHAVAARYEADRSTFKSVEGQTLTIEAYAKLLEGNSSEQVSDK